MLCNGNFIMVIKVQSFVGFVEEYIIESIWNNCFFFGLIFFVECEFFELIGVICIILCEVLQCLVCDGWLIIQYGKFIKVNNFWEIFGLNIFEMLVCFDYDSVLQLIDNLFFVCINIFMIFICIVFCQYLDKVLVVLDSVWEVEDYVDVFVEFDYNIFCGLVFVFGNLIYGLIFNGMKGLYICIGCYYFFSLEVCSLVFGFYYQLVKVCEVGLYDQVYELVCCYGYDSGEIWYWMQKLLFGDLVMNMC